jgi:WD40 repeat protein
MDQTVKIWDLKQSSYEDDPIIIYDHDDEVLCADIRGSDSLLCTMDIKGTILVRNLNDPETVLYTINSVPKEVEDFARVVFNS